MIDQWTPLIFQLCMRDLSHHGYIPPGSYSTWLFPSLSQPTLISAVEIKWAGSQD